MQNYRKTSHSTYDCKYHIVWITKYRKKVMVGLVAERVRELIRQICKEHEVEILKGHVSKDPVHMFVKQNQLGAINMDGSAHDQSHGVRIQNRLADAIRAEFPEFIAHRRIPRYRAAAAADWRYMRRLACRRPLPSRGLPCRSWLPAASWRVRLRQVFRQRV